MDENPSPVPCSAAGRQLYALAAIILPVPCFLLADGAYLLLKPPEWVAWAALRTLLPQAAEMANRLYTSGDTPRTPDR